MRLDNSLKANLVNNQRFSTPSATMVDSKHGNLSSPVNNAKGTCYECNEYTEITGSCASNSSHLLCSLTCQLAHSC
jgi:hypothetical protein